ncbi:hypothetical protein A11S_1435 [Micavibrio aeruginosavorus EPB]|uniref:Aminotransferase class V domain-containing protein n=2 Tax=Micavibrio aeruginosavorus TaxID=349221 RepID=M4VYH8_9BACT|nr:hypothetical protein A11S_1435 [Micavibrio aeruginosavorus EPB]
MAPRDNIMMSDFRKLFGTALAMNANKLHFAAHSHHLWPDCTRTAQTRYWGLSASMADNKWDVIFNTVIPTAQGHVARILNLPDPRTIGFAPNTHEFINRLISALPSHPHIITTDSEFHSLTRQLKRLEEDGLITVTRVPSEPFHSFTDRMIEAVKSTPAAMVFFSHVFFNSAYAVPDLKKIVDAVPDKDTLVVIDGYHGFMALPTDLSMIADRAFYLAGGYKYAMAGEGCCFLHCPPGYAMRPRNTGWFADMGSLEARQGDDVPYSTDGFRFWGATFDPSGLYRLNAVMEMLNDLNVGVADIHAHVMALQDQFLESLKKRPGTLISPVDTPTRGHFLTFETDRAADFAQKLQDLGVVTDHRGTRLRFGFGLYHVADDVERLVTVLNTVIR